MDLREGLISRKNKNLTLMCIIIFTPKRAVGFIFGTVVLQGSCETHGKFHAHIQCWHGHDRTSAT